MKLLKKILSLLFVAMSFIFSNVPVMAQEPQNPAVDLVNYRLVDLTYTFDESTVYWPNSPFNFELTEQFAGQTDNGFYYSSNSFRAPEHGGTHMDAPIHFAENKNTMDEVPIKNFVAPVVVIDISDKAAKDPDYRLTADDVKNWENENGKIPKGAIAMLRTGFGKYYPDRLKYLGDNTPGETANLHFPSYSLSSAEYLVHQCGVKVLGIDTASIDYGQSTHFMAHVLAGKANVSGLENVANLDKLPLTGAWVIALPMKIGKGTGAPTRVIALVPR